MAADIDCLAVTRHGISAALEARIREVTMQPPCLNVHGLLVGAGIKSNVRLRKPVIDVARAMDFTVPGIIAHESAMQGGTWLDVPLFS